MTSESPSAQVQHPHTSVQPTVQKGGAAQPAVEQSMEPPVEAAPEPPVEAAPAPPVEVVPAPPGEAAPEPPVEAAPEPPVEVVLEPPVEAIAEPPVEAASEPPVEVAPALRPCAVPALASDDGLFPPAATLVAEPPAAPASPPASSASPPQCSMPSDRRNTQRLLRRILSVPIGEFYSECSDSTRLPSKSLEIRRGRRRSLWITPGWHASALGSHLDKGSSLQPAPPERQS